MGCFGGALSFAVAGLVLAVKAAWSFGGERAGSVVTVLILVYLAVYPPAVLDPAWNVNIGITYLIVTGVTGWAVSNGKFRWLPFLVLAASFDCQCHLIFVLPALTIVLVSLGFGLATWVVRNAGKWSEVYLAAGVSVAVGIAVWLAPILQQTGNDPGNMTLLLRSTSGGNAAKAGFTLGAQTVGSSILPYESWIVHPHPPDFWSVFAVLEAHGTVPSLMALAGLSIVLIAALGQRNLTVATGAALTLCSGLAFVWTFASIPHRSLFSLLYVYQAVWPIGIAATACYLWLAAVLLRKGVYSPRRWVVVSVVAAASRGDARVNPFGRSRCCRFKPLGCVAYLADSWRLVHCGEHPASRQVCGVRSSKGSSAHHNQGEWDHRGIRSDLWFGVASLQ